MDKIISVSELNNYIKSIIDNDIILGSVRVEGELSNYKMYPSGHHYFTMKDNESSLRCVMFKGNASKLRFKPTNGMKVIAFGRVSVYQRDGAYQLYVSDLTPDGVGDLHIAFQQLYDKLKNEGLFESQHKKPLPKFPATIAVITSSAGAAVRDIIRILGVRWPMADVVVLPVRVQGVEAPPEIIEAINHASSNNIADVIITGRGGGSLEDLWAFNDEGVARAIFASNIPIISSVGHEPDVTIADFVADVRASTPSNAAEIAVPDQSEIREALMTMSIRLRRCMESDLKSRRRRIEEFANRRVMLSPRYYVEDKRLSLDRSQDKLLSAIKIIFSKKREKYSRLAAGLDALSPLKVLGRGYAIAHHLDGSVIKESSDVKAGDRISVQLQKSEINCIVE